MRLPPPDPVALGLAVAWAADRGLGDPPRHRPVAALGGTTTLLAVVGERVAATTQRA